MKADPAQFHNRAKDEEFAAVIKERRTALDKRLAESGLSFGKRKKK